MKDPENLPAEIPLMYSQLSKQNQEIAATAMAALLSGLMVPNGEGTATGPDK